MKLIKISVLMLLYFVVNVTSFTPDDYAQHYNVTLTKVLWVNNPNLHCGYAWFSGKIMLNHVCDSRMDYVMEHEVRHVHYFRVLAKQEQRNYCALNGLKYGKECFEVYADDFS